MAAKNPSKIMIYWDVIKPELDKDLANRLEELHSDGITPLWQHFNSFEMIMMQLARELRALKGSRGKVVDLSSWDNGIIHKDGY